MVQTGWFVKLKQNVSARASVSVHLSPKERHHSRKARYLKVLKKKQLRERFCTNNTWSMIEGEGLSSCFSTTRLLTLPSVTKVLHTEAIKLFFTKRQKLQSDLRQSGPQAQRSVCFRCYPREAKQRKYRWRDVKCVIGVRRQHEKLWVRTYCETWCEYNSVMSLFLFLRTRSPAPFRSLPLSPCYSIDLLGSSTH